ncbi:hypothetical protein Y025_5727 [Burkholderia pseudomallei TSV32]|nr:hypothetical protein Y025_5727 [Burkholderia pseudomallei TSV32]
MRVVRQFRLAVAALRATRRQRHMLIERCADRIERGGVEIACVRQTANQRGDLERHTLAGSQCLNFVERGSQFIALFAQLRVEPVSARLRGTQLLQEVEFLAIDVAQPLLICRRHAAQRIELDEHRLHAPLGFCDRVLDLLRIVLSVLAQFRMQRVDPLA